MGGGYLDSVNICMNMYMYEQIVAHASQWDNYLWSIVVARYTILFVTLNGM